MTAPTQMTLLEMRRSLIVKAGRDLLHKRYSQDTPYLSAEDVHTIRQYRKRVSDIDKELAIIRPTVSTLNRLKWVKMAQDQRKHMVRMVVPMLEDMNKEHKAFKKTKGYRDFGKQTDKMCTSFDDLEYVSLVADDITSQSDFLFGETQPNDDIFDEMVTKDLGHHCRAYKKQLLEGEGVHVNVIQEERELCLPEVPVERRSQRLAE